MVKPKPHGRIPLGWREHEEMPGHIEEVPEELEALEYIKNISGNFSLDDLTAVFIARTGRQVSRQGINKFLKREGVR